MIRPETSIAMTRALMAGAFDESTVATLTLGPLPKPLTDEHRQRIGEFQTAAAYRADAHLVVETPEHFTVHAFVRNNTLPRSA